MREIVTLAQLGGGVATSGCAPVGCGEREPEPTLSAVPNEAGTCFLNGISTCCANAPDAAPCGCCGCGGGGGGGGATELRCVVFATMDVPTELDVTWSAARRFARSAARQSRGSPGLGQDGVRSKGTPGALRQPSNPRHTLPLTLTLTLTL